MMEDVVISIRSVQGCGTGREDSLEFSTDGLYTFDGEVGCLTYMESEVTGLTGTRTSVMVMPDRIVVDRDGMLTSRMVFQEGQRNQFQYNTPFGTANMSMDTRSIDKAFDKDGGRMQIDYVVDVEHKLVSKNRFQLTVKKQTPFGA